MGKTASSNSSTQGMLSEGIAPIAEGSTAQTSETPLTPEIASNAEGLLNAAKLKRAMVSVKDRASLALSTVAVGGALAIGQPAIGMESPYEALAEAKGTTLVLKEDPAKNPELLALLAKFKRDSIIEKLPKLTITQRERVMGYYKLAKSQP